MDTEATTFVSALYSKYSVEPSEVQNRLTILSANAPGMTASGDLRVPTTLGLNSFDITLAGSSEDITRVCKNVTELDLAQNRMSSWAEVFSILDCLPRLSFLNLTKNPLEQLTMSHGKTYPTLKGVALNFTSLSWDSIKNLLAVMPNLEEIFLSGNSYKIIDSDLPPFPTLHTLQLTSNHFSSWKCICKLDKVFPNLRSLVLADNDIVDCDDIAESSQLFSHLKILNMNNTKISKWNDLERLSTIASLCDIRLASIPLLKEFDEVKRRQLLSVYFPHVEKLNGSKMSEAERETAERVFIRQFMDEDEKPERFWLMEKKHGKLDPLVTVDMSPTETISVNVVCGENEESFEFPSRWKISQLRKSLKSFVGTSKFRLYHVAHGGISTHLPAASSRHLHSIFKCGNTLICDIDPTSVQSIRVHSVSLNKD